MGLTALIQIFEKSDKDQQYAVTVWNFVHYTDTHIVCSDDLD